MKNIRVMLITLLSVFLFSACVTPGKVGEESPAKHKLSDGVASYEDGDYKSSMESLLSALDMGLRSKDERIRAHKYLAFIHCIFGQEAQCRDEFRQALEIDPAFDLKPAEAGHPIWGPVFRSEKSKYTK